MKENRKPHVFMLRAAAVLLILVLLSASMVAGRYARYTTTASGSDSARVAKFHVTHSGEIPEAVQTIRVNLRPGEKCPYSIQVVNDSEVAVAYTITAKSKYENLPLEFSLIDSDQPVAAAVLVPGETKDLQYQVSWPADKNDDKYIGMVDLIHLTIQASQID